MSEPMASDTRGAAASIEPVLSVEDLAVTFTTREGVVRAVDGISWDIRPGETLGIVGESGSGKSVSALAILGLIPQPPGKVERGRALFKGTDLICCDPATRLKLRGDRISMIFQDPMTALNPVIRIGKQVGEPLRIHRGKSSGQFLARSAELMESVGARSTTRTSSRAGCASGR